MSVKKILIVIIILITATTVTVADENNDSDTKLEDAIVMTLRNNPEINIAEEKINQAEATLMAAKSSLYPSLNLAGTFTRFNKSSTLSMPDFEALATNPASTATVEKTLQPDHSWGGNMTLSVPIVVASLYPAIGATKLGKDAIALAFNFSQESLVYNSTNLYLYSLSAKNAVQISKTALSTAKDHLDAAKKRFASGAGAHIDVTRSELLTGEADLNLNQSIEDFELSKKILKILMGSEFNNPTPIKDENIDITDERGIAKDAIGKRKDYKIAEIEFLAAEKAHRSALLSYFPTLLAQGTFNLQDTENFNGDNYSWQGMILLNFNIFSGFKSSAELLKTKSIFAEKKKNLIALMQKIEREVATAISHIKKSNSKCEIAKKQLSLAELNKNASFIAYEKGALSHLDYIDAYSAWISARVGLSLSEVQIQLAKTEYKWVTGGIIVPKY